MCLANTPCQFPTSDNPALGCAIAESRIGCSKRLQGNLRFHGDSFEYLHSGPSIFAWSKSECSAGGTNGHWSSKAAVSSCWIGAERKKGDALRAGERHPLKEW